jgi:hypothetical protein
MLKLPLILTATATAIAVAVPLASASAAPEVPLQQRLLAPNELAGYTPTSVKTLDLDGYARAGGLAPKAKRKLASGGFVVSALEQLRGPGRPIPAEVGESQASVVRFRTTDHATRFLRWIKRTYGSSTLPPNLHSEPFRVPGMPNAENVHYWTSDQDRIDQYESLFTRGPYLYDVDAYTLDGALTADVAATGVAGYYKRLPRT